MNHLPALLPTFEPEALVGTWRRFGDAGPVYQIIADGTALPGKDRTLRIRVIETGEEIDYRLIDALDDPQEI